MRKKIFLIVLCLVLGFNLLYVPKADAWPVSASIANMVPESLTSFATMKEAIMNSIETVKKYADQILWAIAKAAALIGSQMAVSALLDSGDGQAPFVADWNQYLYLSPKQRTMTYMNSLFNQSTRGRTSPLNYEGIGQKYDQYLLRQAQDAISPKPVVVNLRESCSDPNNIFDGSSFRCLNSFLMPQNNPAGIVMMAQGNYTEELDKSKTLADKKQVNGFLPKEKNGRIFSPAALLQTGFLKLDDMGVNTITSAQEGAWKDIAIGVSARIAGALMQDAFGTKASQTAARQSGAAASQTYINSQLKTGISSGTTIIKNNF